jgi:tetratricopeptide (TPR) repeat protein
MRAATGDCNKAITDLSTTDHAILANPDASNLRHTIVWPRLAYAWAQTGKQRSAEALIATTPLDCTLCLEMRGRIAALGGRANAAAHWFEQTIEFSPSIPFAYTDWGAMLLRRGDYSGSIAKFEQAHEKGPHFADPLELWGEALMQENRSDLALAKFEEANKYTPRWGRLHLKWGEALFYLGRRDEARAQVQAARAMDLSSSDRTKVTADMRALHV